MKLYRILTEAKNANAVERLVGEYFPGYSVLYQDGFWKGEKERSMVIEVMAEAIEYHKVMQIAKQIKLCNVQDAVLVQTLDVESEMI
jgi:hypothetical protein